MGNRDFKREGEIDPVLIFIVEDSDMYALMLEHKLKKTNNFIFRKFTNGEDCIKNIHQHPNLIILDYNLTGMNGLETLKIIKKENYSIPVVIISAQQDLKVAINMFGAGAFEYIPKDHDTLNELSRTIERIAFERVLK